MIKTELTEFIEGASTEDDLEIIHTLEDVYFYLKNAKSDKERGFKRWFCKNKETFDLLFLVKPPRGIK